MSNIEHKSSRIIHLIGQLMLRRRMTTGEAATEIGIPRSSLDRHMKEGVLPAAKQSKAIDWLAGQLGAAATAVERIVVDPQAHGLPASLLELDCATVLRVSENAPSEIANQLTSRWPAGKFSIICTQRPPLFLLTSALRRRVLDACGVCDRSLLERSRDLHARIAYHIFLDTRPARWELILSRRALVALHPDPSTGITEFAACELAEVWKHNFQEDRRLQIHVMPDTAEARTVEQHFSDAAAVVLVDGVFRWKESADHQHVTVVDQRETNSLLQWDQQVIDLARNLACQPDRAFDAAEAFGVTMNDQEIKSAIKKEHRRKAA